MLHILSLNFYQAIISKLFLTLSPLQIHYPINPPLITLTSANHLSLCTTIIIIEDITGF